MAGGPEAGSRSQLALRLSLHKAPVARAKTGLLALAQGIEQRLETVVIDLLHQGQQLPQFPLGYALAGKPVVVMARSIVTQPVLVLPIRLLAGHTAVPCS